MELLVIFVVILGIGLTVGFTLGYLATKACPSPTDRFNIEEDLERNRINGAFQEMQLEATRIFDVIKSI